MYKKGTGNDKDGKDAGNRTLCPYRNFSQAINAENSLHNVYGFSPSQLVFGRNPNLPSVLNDKLPAPGGHTSSEVVANHLNAKHGACKTFIECEASEKIR